HNGFLPCPAHVVLCRLESDCCLRTQLFIAMTLWTAQSGKGLHMPFRLASAQTAATEAQTRARALLDLGEASGAEMVYETLLATLDLLLRFDNDAQPASERTLLMITGANQRLPIDALYPTRLDQLATRIGAISDI